MKILEKFLFRLFSSNLAENLNRQLRFKNKKMKKLLLPLLFALPFLHVQAQENVTTTSMNDEAATMNDDSSSLNDYDHWSIELSGGVHKPSRNFAPGYYTQTPSFFQGGLGVRYMFNNKFGLRLGLGYNNIDSDDDSLPFEASYYRASLEGVINLTNVLGFSEWTNTFGLLVHGGGGYSFIKHKEPFDLDGKDNMLHIMGGITPQIRITNSIALFADVSAIANVRQTLTWDGTQNNNVTGVDGLLVNASVGLTFYLGSAEKHADWYASRVDLSEQVDDLENRLSKVETDLIDTDQDGVPDYLDREPNTMSGVAVDTKGVAVDKNKNGIPDEIESGLDSRYVKLEDYKNGGNGSNGVGVADLLNDGYVNVYFQFNSDKPEAYSLEAINYLIKYMNSNPSSKADLIGYADEIGNDGYNKALSERRAKKVYDILIASGVDAGRLSYTGNGEDASVDKGSSDARQLVRRVTFKLK